MRVNVTSGSANRIQGQFRVHVKGNTLTDVLRGALAEAIDSSGVDPNSAFVQVAGPDAWQISADLKDHDDEARSLFDSLVKSLRETVSDGNITISVRKTADLSVFDLMMEACSQGCWRTFFAPRRPEPKSDDEMKAIWGELAGGVVRWLADQGTDIWVGAGILSAFNPISSDEFEEWFTAQVIANPNGRLSAATRLDSQPLVVKYELGGYINVFQAAGPEMSTGVLEGLRDLHNSVSQSSFTGVSDFHPNFLAADGSEINPNSVYLMAYCRFWTESLFDVGGLTLIPEELLSRARNLLDEMFLDGTVTLDGRLLEVTHPGDSQVYLYRIGAVRNALMPLIDAPPS